MSSRSGKHANNGLPDSASAIRVEAAVKTIGREQPAQQEWVGVAADSLTFGEGLEAMNQSSLQDFLWYETPRDWPQHEWVRVAYGAFLLLDRLGLARYAEIARSETTRSVYAAWKKDPHAGYRRYRSATRASGIEPPGTDAFGWSTVMGMEELGCHVDVSNALEAAIASGELRPGTAGWRARAIGITERTLEEQVRPMEETDGSPHRRSDLVLAERIRSWRGSHQHEQLVEWRCRAADTFLDSGVPVAPPVPGIDSIEAALAPMTWLLMACGDGVKPTAAGYLPSALVRDAVDRFDWWEMPGQPRTEGEVHQLSDLREIATRTGWLRKRSGKIRTTRRGIGLIDDPVALWHAVTATLGQVDAFSRAVSELVAHRLLEGPAETRPLSEDNQLTQAIAPAILYQGWREGVRPLQHSDIDRATWEPNREWRLFGLLDEESPTWREGRSIGRCLTALSETGRAAAWAHLFARATEPRGSLYD